MAGISQLRTGSQLLHTLGTETRGTEWESRGKGSRPPRCSQPTCLPSPFGPPRIAALWGRSSVVQNRGLAAAGLEGEGRGALAEVSEGTPIILVGRGHVAGPPGLRVLTQESPGRESSVNRGESPEIPGISGESSGVKVL